MIWNEKRVFIGKKCYKRQLLRPRKCMDYYQFFPANLSDLEYFEYMVEKFMYGLWFLLNSHHWTQISYQNWKRLSNIEFRNHLGVEFLEMKGISKFFICIDFSTLMENLCLVMKIEWKLYPIRQYLEHVVKIFQIRRVCAKKIDDNLCTFVVLKGAFLGTYD